MIIARADASSCPPVVALPTLAGVGLANQPDARRQVPAVRLGG